MCASHSWSVCCHPIVQHDKTPLMFAAENESEQCTVLVELLLKHKADVNGKGPVSAWEGDGLGCHMHGVASGWIITVCSPVR